VLNGCERLPVKAAENGPLHKGKQLWSGGLLTEPPPPKKGQRPSSTCTIPGIIENAFFSKMCLVGDGRVGEAQEHERVHVLTHDYAVPTGA
jgi:hypothetical protein